MPAMNMNRTAFYALALFTALLQSLFGTMVGFAVGAISGKLAGLSGLVTWLWIMVLMIYNRKPQSTNPLSRAYTHLSSFLVFGVAWLAIFITLACQISWECKGKPVWCPVARFSTALAFFTSLFSLVTTYLLYRSVAASGLGLAGNVDQESKESSQS